MSPRLRENATTAIWFGLVALVAVGGSIEGLAEHRGAPGVLTSAGMAGALALSWRRPLAGLVAQLLVAVAQAPFDNPLYDLSFPLYAIPAAVGIAGSRERGGRFWAVPVLAMVTITVVLAVSTDAPVGDAIVATCLMVGLPLLVGRTFQTRSVLNEELRERARRLEIERHARAEEAAAQERRRIAGDLHDIIAHSVSGMVVQAGAARRLVGAGDPRAADSIRAIEEGGREALTELRRLLGVLRREDADLALAPQPSLARVGLLVERLRAQGATVELEVRGEQSAMGPGVDLAAYRIVEDSLRTATGPARVTVAYGAGHVELVVEGAGADPPAGLGERVRLFGGELVRRGGVLRARLPLYGGST